MFGSLLSITRLAAAPVKRFPGILCGSFPLVLVAAFCTKDDASASHTVSTDTVLREFKQASLSFTSSSASSLLAAVPKKRKSKGRRAGKCSEEIVTFFPGSESSTQDTIKSHAQAQREAKRVGFECALRWCAAHQERSVMGGSGELAELDAAALTWVNDGLECFSCEQCLSLIGLLCDVLYSATACSASYEACNGGTNGSSRESGNHKSGDGDSRVALQRLCNSLYHAIVRVISKVESSAQLETQRLAPLVSAVYGLHRVTCDTSPVALDAVAQAPLQPPTALLFAMVHTLQKEVDALTHSAESRFNTENGGGSGGDGGDVSNPEESLSASIASEKEDTALTLLTAMLVLTPQRRDELLPDKGKRLVRNLVTCFCALVQPIVDHHCALMRHSGCGDKTGKQYEDIEDTEKERTALEHTAGIAATQLTMLECAMILRNIHSTRCEPRVQVLQYLLLVAKPAGSLTIEEVDHLPAVFAAIRGIPSFSRAATTDYIISHLSCQPSMLTAVQLLPYVSHPSQYVSMLNLTPAAIGGLSCIDAASIVHVSGEVISWATLKLLLQRSLSDSYPHLARYISTVTPGDGDPPAAAAAAATTTTLSEKKEGGECDSSSTVSLTPLLCAMLHAVLQRMMLPGARSSAGPNSDALPSEVPPMRETERAEACAVARQLAYAINWKEGVLLDNSSALAVPSIYDISFDQQPQYFAVKALSAYATCVATHPPLLPASRHLGDLELLNLYGRFFFSSAGVNMWNVVRVSAELVPLLKGKDSRYKFVQRAVRYNKAGTVSARYRFLDVLAPLAVQNSVRDAEQAEMLLKHRSLFPSRLSSISLRGATFEHVYARHVVNAIDFILASAEWAQLDRVESLRGTMNSWISFYCEEALLSQSEQAEASVKQDTEEEEGEAAGDHVEDHEASLCVDAVTSNNISEQVQLQQDLECVLAAALRAGCKLPQRMFGVVARSMQLNERSVTSVSDSALGSDKEPSNEARESRQDGEDEIAVHGAASEELPAHFVFAVRGDMYIHFALSPSTLRSLLTAADVRLMLVVLGTFLAVSRRRGGSGPDDIKSALDEVAFCSVGLQIFLDRLPAGTDGDKTETARDELCYPQSASRVASSLVRTVLAHIARSPATSAALRRLNAPPSPQSDAQSVEEIEGDHEEVAPDLPAETEASLEALEPMREDLQDLLRRTLKLLSPGDVKELSLSVIHHLEAFFPQAASDLATALQGKMGTFTQGELLMLASKYAPAAPLVRAELEQHDIRLTVEFNDFLKCVKGLPMDLIDLITRSHLPFLSFAWCTRLLSALAPRHEEMPTPLLAAILARVRGLADDEASDANRNLLLLVLQGYVLFAGDNKGPAFVDSVEGVMATATDKEAAAVSTSEVLGGVNISPSCVTLSVEEKCARRDMVRACCDKLLLLESVTSVEALRSFLLSYPQSLQALMENAVVLQAEKFVLGALLDESPVPDARKLLQAAQLLHQHGLLYASTTHLIKCRFYDALPAASEGKKRSLLSDESGVPLADRVDTDAAAEHSGPAAAVTELVESESAAPVQLDLKNSTQLAAIIGLAVPRWSRDAAVVDKMGKRKQQRRRTRGQIQKQLESDTMAALTMVRQCFPSPVSQLEVLTTLIDMPQVAAAVNASVAPSGGTHHIRTASGALLNTCAESLCTDLLCDCAALSASEFAKFVQNISRIKKWSLAREWAATQQRQRQRQQQAEEGKDGSTTVSKSFDQVFQTSFRNADAHSRCIVIKAVSSDAEIFAHYETFMITFITKDVPVLSHEDLELLLSSTLNIANPSMAEALLDAIGTRLITMLSQCRRSTLVRLLQCHAVLGVHDDPIVMNVLNALEAQCVYEVKLDVNQIITLLDAIVRLDLPTLPEKLVVGCFSKVETLVGGLSSRQLAALALLAIDLDMGYTASIHALVTRLLENREGYRTSSAYRSAVEKVCFVYDVEAPSGLRIQRTRKYRQRERIADYWARQSFLGNAEGTKM